MHYIYISMLYLYIIIFHCELNLFIDLNWQLSLCLYANKSINIMAPICILAALRFVEL